MGLLSQLFGTGIKETSEGVKAALQGVGSLAQDVKTIITGKIAPDKEAEIMIKITELTTSIDTTQNLINLEEAKSDNLFKSGWRPALGWTCNIAIFFYYIPPIIGGTVLWLWQCAKAGIITPRPAMDISELLTLLASLLGMATLRQIDKGRR